MIAGRRAAIDVGTVRLGLAVSDAHAILASGLATVIRKDEISESVKDVVEAFAETEPCVIYVGLPISLAGRETASTGDAIEFAKQLRAAATVPVRMVDERLSTVTAAGALRTSNRNSKDGRKIIDQIAATVILEQAMATEKSSGNWAGVSVDDI